MESINNKKCLYDRGTNCYVLRSKKCFKCKFFKENTEDNRIKYIENVKKDIKKYARDR